MSARLPCPDSSTQGTVVNASHSTPGTAHNDNGSRSTTPWTRTLSEACSSQTSDDSARSEALHGQGCAPHRKVHTRCIVPATASACFSDMFEISSPLDSYSRERYGQQPSPCARMSLSNQTRTEPSGQSQSALKGSAVGTGRTIYLPSLSGFIGDRRLETGKGIKPGSSDVLRLQTPVRGDANSTGFGMSIISKASSPDNTNLGHSSATIYDTNDASIYYQPMSNLMATCSPGQPGPIAVDKLSLNHPSASVLHNLTSSVRQIGLNDTAAGPVARIRRHFSPHYQGDIFLPANQSEDIADDLNCSLFIVNLPPNLTTHELLAAIHKLGPFGRIFAIHINGPEVQRNHPGCAAKVVFFKREVAYKFFTQCELNGFRVKGHNARVMWNRIKTSEKPHLADSDASRVLLIGGPPSLVNSSTLTDFFHTKLEFQIDSIITHVQGSVAIEDTVIEYRFGSFRCQAQAAKMALARELPHIRCFFGKDPLEPEVYRPFEYFSFTENV